jgi:hypothetical protein
MSRYKMLEECTKLVSIGGGRWWEWAMGQGEIEGSKERERPREKERLMFGLAWKR